MPEEKTITLQDCIFSLNSIGFSPEDLASVLSEDKNTNSADNKSYSLFNTIRETLENVLSKNPENEDKDVSEVLNEKDNERELEAIRKAYEELQKENATLAQNVALSLSMEILTNPEQEHLPFETEQEHLPFETELDFSEDKSEINKDLKEGVITNPQLQNDKNGKPYLKFDLETGDETIKCIAFGNKANELASLSENQKISIDISQQTDKDSKSMPFYRVNSFTKLAEEKVNEKTTDNQSKDNSCQDVMNEARKGENYEKDAGNYYEENGIDKETKSTAFVYTTYKNRYGETVNIPTKELADYLDSKDPTVRFDKLNVMASVPEVENYKYLLDKGVSEGKITRESADNILGNFIDTEKMDDPNTARTTRALLSRYVKAWINSDEIRPQEELQKDTDDILAAGQVKDIETGAEERKRDKDMATKGAFGVGEAALSAGASMSRIEKDPLGAFFGVGSAVLKGAQAALSIYEHRKKYLETEFKDILERARAMQKTLEPNERLNSWGETVVLPPMALHEIQILEERGTDGKDLAQNIIDGMASDPQKNSLQESLNKMLDIGAIDEEEVSKCIQIFDNLEHSNLSAQQTRDMRFELINTLNIPIDENGSFKLDDKLNLSDNLETILKESEEHIRDSKDIDKLGKNIADVINKNTPKDAR